MSDDIEFKIARLDLQPGDILVLKLEGPAPYPEINRWREDLKRFVGNHKVMILENGADLAILTAAEIEALAGKPL